MDHTQSENLGLSASGLMRVSDPTIPLPFGFGQRGARNEDFSFKYATKVIAGNVCCMPFFDGLPTVKCSLRRHKNRVIRVERGDNGRVVPVELLNAASYFIANARICWAICGSAVSFSLARTGTAHPIANPARASSTMLRID